MTGVPPSGSGCQPTASAAGASSQSGIPNAGEWAVVRASYGRPRVQQIAKVTPKLIKFAGLNWPRQCSRQDLLVSLPDKEAAEMVSQSLAGAGGQREARIRKAGEDFEERKAAAWDSYDRVAARIIASAIEARSDATGTGAAEGESAVPTADAPSEQS